LKNQNENILNQDWEKVEKINKMLADHKKKKSIANSRGPLSQVNENIRSLELVGYTDNDFVEREDNKYLSDQGIFSIHTFFSNEFTFHKF